MKKRLIIGLCVLLLAAMMPWSGAAAEEPAMRLEYLRQKYPHGAYWNHTKGGSEDYTWTPCTHHTGNCAYNGFCGCNTYQNVAIQCMGFAYQAAAVTYGCDPRAEWPTYRDASALDTLKAGDIVRYRWNGHSIFVTAVEGDTVTYVDVNGDGHCQIQWDRTVTKATLAASFTYVKASPYALPPEEKVGMTVTASATALETEQEVTLTVCYNGGAQGIGGLMGTLTYDAARFAYLSHEGDGVEVNAADGAAKYVYFAADQQASTKVVFTVTFRVLRHGDSRFAVATEEWVDDKDYTSLGTPDAAVAVQVAAPPLLGDADGDGRVNNRDLGLLQRYLNDWEVTVTAKADMDGDGKINNKDLGLLQRALNKE